jgi:hypothetical protein
LLALAAPDGALYLGLPRDEAARPPGLVRDAGISPEQAVLESTALTVAGLGAAGAMVIVMASDTTLPSSELVKLSVASSLVAATTLILFPSVGRMHAGLNAGRFLITRALTVGIGGLIALPFVAGSAVSGAAAGLILGPLVGGALIFEAVQDIATTPADIREARSRVEVSALPGGAALTLRF